MTQALAEASSILAALGALIIAALIMIGKIHKQSKEVLEQVANTHNTNLREDIDDNGRSMNKILELVLSLTDQINKTNATIEKIRDDIRDERLRITQLDDHAHESHQEIFKRITRLEGVSGERSKTEESRDRKQPTGGTDPEEPSE